MESKTISDNEPCKKCGGRTALVSGTFYFDQDQEPYKSGIHEKAINDGGDFYLHGTVCDDCNELSNLWNDDRYAELIDSNRKLREALERILLLEELRISEAAKGLITQTLNETGV